MSKFLWKTTLAATFGFALTFTFNACQSEDDDTDDSGTTGTKGTFVDSRDNKPYKWVKIGSQTWMAENLNYDISDNGSYNNSCINDDCTTYGRLYDMTTVVPGLTNCWGGEVNCISNPICPDGWHLPSDDEWTKLTEFVGSNAGTKLKAKDYNGTDDYGFAAIPINFNIDDRNYIIGWWSSTVDSCPDGMQCIRGDAAYIRRVSYDESDVFREIDNIGGLNAVRCVK